MPIAIVFKCLHITQRQFPRTDDLIGYVKAIRQLLRILVAEVDFQAYRYVSHREQKTSIRAVRHDFSPYYELSHAPR
jgi:hypothetical protein